MPTIASSAVRFQTSQENVQAQLDVIAEEWKRAGITTPVMDETGEIDPDAVAELLDRLESY